MGKNNSNPRKPINSKYNSIKYCEQNKCLINKVNALLRPIFLQKHAQPDSKWMQQQSMLYMKRIFLCVSKNGQSHKTLCICTPMSFHLSVGMPMLHCLHTSLSEQAHDTMCIYITVGKPHDTLCIYVHPSLSGRAHSAHWPPGHGTCTWT